MHPRDAYVILGIVPPASQEAIRSAYRALAKRYHPDHVGPSGAARFHEVSEAYRVLSDPEIRRAHDRESQGAAANAVAEPLSDASWPAAEPLVPGPLRRRTTLHPWHFRPEEDWLHWTWSPSTVRDPRKSRLRHWIEIEVILFQRGGL